MRTGRSKDGRLISIITVASGGCLEVKYTHMHLFWGCWQLVFFLAGNRCPANNFPAIEKAWSSNRKNYKAWYWREAALTGSLQQNEVPVSGKYFGS